MITQNGRTRSGSIKGFGLHELRFQTEVEGLWEGELRVETGSRAKSQGGVI